MSERSSRSLVRRTALTATLVALALLALVSAAPAPAGTPPNRLDDNRGNFAAQAAVNAFVSLPPIDLFFGPLPFLFRPPFGPWPPGVRENAGVNNVYWEPDWNDHPSSAFSTDSI